MLKIDELNQSYGQSHTLWDVNLEVDDGACVSLIGRNGVGKTTLLECVMGLLKTDSGSIVFNGANLLYEAAERRAALHIGYVPQGRMIFPLLTVAENLEIGLGNQPRSNRTIPDHVFDLFPVLKSMLRRRGGDLSGGQQQQLAIARALVINPDFLILDEPTEGIQPNIVQEIGDVIMQLNRELAMTVLVVEQKLPFVRRVCGQFFIMTKGAVVASGKMDALTDELVQEHLSV
ncbi:MAG: urea ABC transporter ATP-binding subunit UrtE [Pseudomonadota bacterium]|nr:urea ABC transporter ATP-binding subunit UrtE [Gammaproteobacteria bacterium]MEC8867961.1 urea ABC transporter ATP-binding subunit UrtE [Pseudomonadota bacterium]MEC9285663.1 urea ABC transporter ATP-binding subunit UrtE [Pseudomonadota bacterium]HBP15276.1 urea ABC transporter ATP-binding subunit UrtE [Gammaproteobacteria bacterium]HCP49140.1 urea ABC transporter ATP-binding subunit UrtE [Gammaproteobacteria bacterium]|tara:strand:+ start:2580 stop:3275 length:696 start_codon:yes stop_codon:yes gene_type:complete